MKVERNRQAKQEGLIMAKKRIPGCGGIELHTLSLKIAKEIQLDLKGNYSGRNLKRWRDM
jgi:hypothetical protein